jgi:flagellar hook-associated protein 2
VKASSSSSAVTATASAGATPGTFTFSVTSLAAAQVSTANVASSGPVTTGNGLDLTIGTTNPTTTHINVTTDTAQGVADAINGAKLGVTAAVLTTDQGTVLQLSGSTGTKNAFSLAGLSGATTQLTPAADAQITVGDPKNGGYTMSSSTNTFGAVLPNVTLTVSQTTTSPVSVTVTSDANAIADKMQALVDAANGALSQIGTQTAYNPTAKAGAPLTGDYTVREIQSNLLSSVSDGLNGYGSYNQFGVQLDSNGNLKFDRNAFITAYNANPSVVQNAVSTGLAQSLDTVAKAATDPISGSLTSAIQSGNNQVTSLNQQISDWGTRLASKQQSLQLQFTNLEVALGGMKDQSSWLSGQIAGLPAGS